MQSTRNLNFRFDSAIFQYLQISYTCPKCGADKFYIRDCLEESTELKPDGTWEDCLTINCEECDFKEQGNLFLELRPTFTPRNND